MNSDKSVKVLSMPYSKKVPVVHPPDKDQGEEKYGRPVEPVSQITLPF